MKEEIIVISHYFKGHIGNLELLLKKKNITNLIII